MGDAYERMFLNAARGDQALSLLPLTTNHSLLTVRHVHRMRTVSSSCNIHIHMHAPQALFVSAAELVEAWRIFTPLLHQIDEQRPQPTLHAFGSLPAGFVGWAKQRGIEILPTWHEYVVSKGDRVEEIMRVFAELDEDNSGTLNYGGSQ